MGAESSKAESSKAIDVTSGGQDLSKQKELAKSDTAIRSRVRSQQLYTMKVVIRGERGTGKSSLWRRLQGLPFGRDYYITPEIQISTINWNFKTDDESVKVDVWDIVDIGFIAGTTADSHTQDLDGNLKNMISKVNESQGKYQLAPLDATTCDVYKGVRMVVFMVNPYSMSSLNYVEEKYLEVPEDVAILILLNFRDTVKSTAEDPEPNSSAAALSAIHHRLEADGQEMRYIYLLPIKSATLEMLYRIYIPKEIFMSVIMI